MTTTTTQTTPKASHPKRPVPRCGHCGERITARNTRLRYEVYFGTGYPAETINGCRWCAGLDDYTD